MPSLPEPRGPLSEAVVEAVRGHTASFPAGVRCEGDPLGDDDFHLALYVLYELHYRGFDEVHDGWEWDPARLAFRARLERHFEARVREAVPIEPIHPFEVADALHEALAEAPATGFGRYMEHEATLDEFREYVVHRSAHLLKESDPHSFALPRLDGRPKVALAEIQSRELGGGRPDRVHAKLFGDTMQALGLDRRYGAYLAVTPGRTLATVNLMSLFGLHRRLRGAIVGHLALAEMDSSIPSRRYANGLRRLGAGEDAIDFYEEHVHADAGREAIAAHDLAGALARQEPRLTGDIVLGARAQLLLDAALTTALLEAWQEGRSSLLRGAPGAVAAA